MRRKSGTSKERSVKASNEVHKRAEIILVDQTPFLKKALSKCKRLRNELNKKQKLLSEYEDNDRVNFQQWLNRTFGAKFSKVRELEDTIANYDFILFNLSNCSVFCPDKLPEMHKELLERQKNGTLYQFVPPVTVKTSYKREDQDWSDEDEGWDDEDWDDESADLGDESFEDIVDELFGSGEDGSRFKDDGYNFEETYEQQLKLMRSPEESQLKKCYRALAKRLHPDHSTLEESLREKRWHELQDAYQNNDLEAMLRVEAICDIDETDLSIRLGLARLNDLANYHQSHVKPIRRALSEAKKDIAFGFTENGPTKTIRQQMKFELDEKLQMLEFYLVDMKQSVDDILQECMEDQEMYEAPEPTLRTKPKPKKSRKEYNDPRQMDLF